MSEERNMWAATAVAIAAAAVTLGIQGVRSDGPAEIAGVDRVSTAGAGEGPGGEGAVGTVGEPSFAVEIDADASGAFAWSERLLKDVPAGAISFGLHNASDVAHSLAIENATGTVVAGPSEPVQGGSVSVNATLPAGRYTYYCAVPGHREAGMSGTLIVVGDDVAGGAPGPGALARGLAGDYGPWRVRAARNRVLARLRPAIRSRATPLNGYKGGFGIRIGPA